MESAQNIPNKESFPLMTIDKEASGLLKRFTTLITGTKRALTDGDLVTLLSVLRMQQLFGMST